MPEINPFTTAFLLVETSRGGAPVWAAKWRSADGSRVKRRIGAGAWLERDGRSWRTRPGRPKPGFLTERQAKRAMVALIRSVEAEGAARRQRRAAARQPAGPTFRELTHAWLAHLVTVDDVKPSTLRNYRCKLVEPGTPHRRGGGVARGRIMAALGDKAPVAITICDVSTLLDAVVADGVSRRTVNRHRELVVAILNFGLRPERRADWGLTENAAAAAPKCSGSEVRSHTAVADDQAAMRVVSRRSRSRSRSSRVNFHSNGAAICS